MSGDARKQMLEQLRAYLSENRGLDPAVITDDATLDDLGLDSMALTDLGFQLFTSQGITLDDATILDARTIADLVDALVAHPQEHIGDRP